ncbi:hypothetical protein AGMMS50230_02550 [Spirochaetia bacterium]|nr:hypothetical protein AGMMS50230_02550 [Spirochaetia bacterium]
MFENILHQPVVNQIKDDISGGILAPAILFSGPEYSGKGTAALELARVLCCEKTEGSWNCSCSSCLHHRNLVSPDMLVLGKRHFFEETAASSGAFLRNPENAGGRMLFVRSIRKLLLRFNPVLWEDDPKLGKIRSFISALEEELEEFEELSALDKQTPGSGVSAALAKSGEAVIKKAAKLEVEGLGELIPIAQIRRAAYWTRLAPLGNRKCLIIENAENMQEGAKNSLLKILEEPPPRVTIILTSSRPASLLPTMLSRLRDYRFAKRNPKEEAEVISRIFREPPDAVNTIEGYLVSFLPLGSETLYPLGAYFAASAAAEAARDLKKAGREIPGLLLDFGKFAAAEGGVMGRPGDFKSALAKVLKDTGGFEISSLFPRFLKQLGALVSVWLRNETNSGPGKISWADMWRRELSRTALETGGFNIAVPLALERLFAALKTGMSRDCVSPLYTPGISP